MKPQLLLRIGNSTAMTVWSPFWVTAGLRIRKVSLVHAPLWE